MIKEILDLIYPPRCIFCNKILTVETKKDEYSCTKCEDDLPYIPHEICEIKNRNERINNPYKIDSYIDCCVTSFFYEGNISKAISDFKFKGNIIYAKYFAYIMYKTAINLYKNTTINTITYVPMHKFEEKKRYYNQSKILAKYLGKKLKISVDDLLIKVKNNKQQHYLTVLERKENVKDVYNLKNDDKIKGKAILIVDDVVTTCSTLNECAKILKIGGASHIYCITIATPKLKNRRY